MVPAPAQSRPHALAQDLQQLGAHGGLAPARVLPAPSPIPSTRPASSGTTARRLHSPSLATATRATPPSSVFPSSSSSTPPSTPPPSYVRAPDRPPASLWTGNPCGSRRDLSARAGFCARCAQAEDTSVAEVAFSGRPPHRFASSPPLQVKAKGERGNQSRKGRGRGINAYSRPLANEAGMEGLGADFQPHTLFFLVWSFSLR